MIEARDSHHDYFPISSSTDITPLILAAHRDNYGKRRVEWSFIIIKRNRNCRLMKFPVFAEIIKILLDRGATLPLPHDVR